MDNQNNNGAGGFWTGLIIGAVLMFFFYHPKYQGKTAEEWQQTVQDWQTSYNAVGNCLSSKADEWGYSNPEYSNGAIYTYDYSDYTQKADSGWIYSGFNANSLTSPTDEMNSCFTSNTSPQ
jgi:hypothetical protein